MPKITIVCGLLLIALGLLGYTGEVASAEAAEPAAEVAATEDASGGKSVTALIPAFLGGPMLLLGLLGLAESRRKLAMHLAAMLGLLGFLAGAGRGSMGIGKFLNDDPSLNQRSFLFVWLMALICGVFVMLCVQSFRAARKAREAGA